MCYLRRKFAGRITNLTLADRINIGDPGAFLLWQHQCWRCEVVSLEANIYFISETDALCWAGSDQHVMLNHRHEQFSVWWTWYLQLTVGRRHWFSNDTYLARQASPAVNPSGWRPKPKITSTLKANRLPGFVCCYHRSSSLTGCDQQKSISRTNPRYHLSWRQFCTRDAHSDVVRCVLARCSLCCSESSGTLSQETSAGVTERRRSLPAPVLLQLRAGQQCCLQQWPFPEISPHAIKASSDCSPRSGSAFYVLQSLRRPRSPGIKRVSAPGQLTNFPTNTGIITAPKRHQYQWQKSLYSAHSAPTFRGPL